MIEDLPIEKRDAAREWDALFREATGWAPRDWGKAGIGYGTYAYRYASGREGTFMATGFAIRARDVSLHILPGYSDFPDIAARLGPHRRGKSCWYVRSLAAVDRAAAVDLIRAGLDDLRSKWPVEPT